MPQVIRPSSKRRYLFFRGERSPACHAPFATVRDGRQFEAAVPGRNRINKWWS
jgi:hypothetical protein